jgi:hypothetical protein
MPEAGKQKNIKEGLSVFLFTKTQIDQCFFEILVLPLLLRSLQLAENRSRPEA